MISPVNNMAAFCIRPELADKLKAAAKAGEISIEKMYEMSSQDRRGLLEKYVDAESAKGVNAGFERAMASEQKNAIAKWVNNTFSSGEKAKPAFKDITDKIHELDKQGLLTPESEKAFLQDLVAEKLGGTITSEEARQIAKHAAKLEEYASGVSHVNTPTLEYFRAKRGMENYLQSLNPSSNLRVFTSTIGRGAMLLSIKSPLLNVISNSVVAFINIAERRILQRRFNGFNPEFASEFRKFSAKVFRETGYDLSRFQSFEGGIKSLGEEYAHSQGKGAVRAIGRFYEDVAFNKLQGAPDAQFAAFHFADSANLMSSNLALQKGLRGAEAKTAALEIMKDAFSLAPKTKEGQFVRAQAEADALYATYTNKTIASQTALALRGVANTATGDFRLGDIVDPFVKTPANVLSAGLDYSGVTVTAKMATGIVKTLNDVAHLREFDKGNFADVTKYMVKAGLGLTFAYTISSMIKPEDFIGQYPSGQPSQQELLALRNGTTNAIRVGGKWISLDYLGVLGAPILGFLYAKKYGSTNPLDNAFRYGQGVKSTLANFPGVQPIIDAANYIKTVPSQDKGVDKAIVDVGKTALSNLTSRIIPGISNDLAKMTDPYQRSTDKNNIFSKIQNQIPVLREGLPIKNDIFGTPVKTEPWISTLLFGSRVSSNKDSQVINELVKLNGEGALPTITDVSKSSSTARELRTQIGEEKFRKAMEYFGKNLKENFADRMTDSDYEDATPEEKKNMLNNVKTETFNDMLDEYNYQPKEDN